MKRKRLVWKPTFLNKIKLDHIFYEDLFRVRLKLSELLSDFLTKAKGFLHPNREKAVLTIRPNKPIKPAAITDRNRTTKTINEKNAFKIGFVGLLILKFIIEPFMFLS